MFSSGAENGDVTSHSQESGAEVMGNVKKIPTPLSPDSAANALRF